NLLTLIIHFFTLPIIQLGKWLSVNIAKINVFVFILDFLIEAPFKVVIQLIEDAVGYLKEKKEEIY
ncbi:MAG: hypothetical protein ACE5D7_10550, partial [Fidelibacterota bacterium]